MPSGSRKRPDTLELEVLGARQIESSDDECATATRKYQQKQQQQLQQSTKPKNAPTISDAEVSLATQTAKAEPPPRRRWFQLRRHSRRCPAAPAASAAAPQLGTHTNTSTATSAGTSVGAATLALSETTAIDNSTTTIVAPLPTSQTIPDVAAVQPRSSSKKRRSKAQTESLYSLATLAQSGEIQLQPRSEPNVHAAELAPAAEEAARARTAEPTQPSSSADRGKEEKTQAAVNSQCERAAHTFHEREQVLLTLELPTVEEDVIDGATPPTGGLRTSLMSVLGKLAIWKRSNCRRRQSRSSHSTLAGGGGGGADGISGRKSLNVSTDFEQFSTATTTPGGSGVFASAKEKGIRRLSQIRRRRSSYYFSDNERRIRANDRAFNAQFKYADNYIKTSKYSMLTFLPFNLLEQFQRLANFYFLCLLVLQLIPAISSLTPVTTAIPLIGVLTLTAVKDAYDDIQRHLSDSQVNNRRSKALRNGKLVDEKWSGVQVGDVIRLENNQFVAADILLITTSEPNGLCFIETAELDGETNLKCKQCLPETTELGQRHDLLWHFNGEIICERPNNLLNKFEGTLIWRNQRFGLDNEKVLLRGCVLRNTQWCYGVVIFAGKDTKLMQNSGKTQFKSTGVDRLLNFIIIGIVLFLLSICAFFTLACAIWEGFIGQYFQVYLPWENIIPKEVAQGATVIGLLVFFSYAIVLNTVVPISLYVSVEVIRFAQSFLINWDEKMYYEQTKTHAKARTTTLNEELGQIQYIFSDKTGTLTQNIMTFNKCSINGRSYGDVFDLRTGEVIEVTDKQKYVQSSNSSNGNNSKCTPPPPPTILLHAAEVHPKSTIVVSTLNEGGAAAIKLKSAATSAATAAAVSAAQMAVTSPVHKEPPPTVGDAFATEAATPASSSRSRRDSERRVYYRNDKQSPSLSSTVWRSRSSSTSPPSRRLRRQCSTLSNASDKVMILNDLPQKTLIVSHAKNNNSNSSKVLTTIAIATSTNTTTTPTPTIATTTYSTCTIVADADADTDDDVDADLETAALSSPSSAPPSQPSTPSTPSSPCSPTAAAQLTTQFTRKRSFHRKKSKKYLKSATGKKCAKTLCTPFCACNRHDQYAKPKLKFTADCIDTTTRTARTHTNTSTNNTTNPTTRTTDNLLNTNNYATNWSASHHKVHALEPVDFSANPEYEPEFRWYDKTLLDAVRSDEEHAHNFFRLLALCHTVMPEYVEGHLEYQAQSPDESALVSAARNFGFVFRSRTPSSITIEVMGRTEEYELLNILDFNNVRKRMSVILRRGDNIVLYSKGADNVIYDRLGSSQNDIKTRTQEHLNKFAGEGLRTLVLAERRLDEAYYNDWRQRQQEASVSMDGREDKLSAIYEEIESELTLVGVTAIEDKLQDGVPQTIANLQMAGIKIWVLTGDKQETAINIGYSCQLLTDELADVFIVDGSSLEEVDKQLRQFRESVRIVNRFRPTPLEPNVNLNLNGSNNIDRHTSSSMMGSSAFRAQVSPPPPPAISVVTFRWDEDKIKHNKGEPDSAECNELYDSLEKDPEGATALPDHEILEENTGFAIVINGHSLVHCLSPELESRFLDIASQCKSVICCRVTPLQKALVVELIKRAKNAVTLAIGDGANDVSMIKAAHIGVGISGQEGLQAVLASDYSIAQFRYLERLLLVHGRWSYYRMCKFLRYFFYKNFAFTLCHCWYSFFCGFSAQTVFDPMFISVYNLFYTSLPVLALGVFEQDVSDKHSVEYPKLYTPGLKSQLFNTREFVYSVLHGVFSSLILFLIPYGTYKEGVSPNGLILSDHMTLGAVVATILIIDNTAQIALYTSYWTIFNHITIWGSLVCYIVLDYFYNYVFGGPYVGSLSMAMKDLTFWTTMLITVTVIMAPVLAYKFYLIDVHPSLEDKIRLKRREASLRSRQSNVVLRTPSARKARRSLRSGYAFAHQEGFGRLITSGKIMRKLPQELAFPLGLGSKKVQGTAPDSSDGKPNQNNNNSTKNNKNSSTGYLNENDAEGGAGGGGAHGISSENASPRAPCQDLDTINL